MADHFDAVPDPRTDITDLYAFPKPGDATQSVLIFNVNPLAPTLATAFDPQASYELKIDTNADAQAEIAFHVSFDPAGDGQQTATVHQAKGADAQRTGRVGEVIIHDAPASFDREAQITTAGEYRFYAGLRSDPFFVEPEGFGNNFQFSGHDANADKSVFGIVLEVPNHAFGLHTPISLWAQTMAPVHGVMTSMDQMGRGGNFYNQGEEDKRTFNRTPPSEQRALFLDKFTIFFQTCGYSEAEARRIAFDLLPDILHYDYSRPAGFPNGRLLTDDIVDVAVSLLSKGRVTTDRLGPHTDYLKDFPYLGTPHEVAAP